MRDRNVYAASSTLGAVADDVVTACIKQRGRLPLRDGSAFTNATRLVSALLAEASSDASLWTPKHLTPMVQAVWSDAGGVRRGRLLRLVRALLRRAATGDLDDVRLRVLQGFATVVSADTLAAAAGQRCGSSPRTGHGYR